MHRSIGKRIRIDDPLPPEYDTMVNPMTPAAHRGRVSPQNIASPSPYASTYDDTADRTYAPESSLNSEDTSFQATQFTVSGTTSANNYQGAVFNEPGQIPETSAYIPHDMHAPTAAEQIPTADYGQSTPSSQTSPGHQTPPNDQQETRRITRARLKNANQPPVHTYGATKSKRTEERDKDKGKEKKAKRSKKPRQEIGYIESTDLYTMVLEGKNALTAIVDMWVEQYKMNSDNALILMMNFFINSSGCKGKLTAEMRSSMDHASMIRRMTEEFDEESAEYPIIMKGEQWKKFRQNYCDFVATLVKQLQYSIIYDQNLMDNVVSLLTGLSDSQVRAFRHTATLGAMKLMTALVDVALVVSINMDNTQRQYAAERQKTRDKRASDRLESLMAKRGELEENQDEIKNMMTFIFKSIFVHRYRDVVPEIRAICLSEIGIWMKKFHKNFLDDSYLKYIGWTLHDKVGEVRLKCLQALQPLYASEELTEKLELFTSKFKDRIVQMTLDKDYECAVNAVKLITSIQRHHKDLLSDKDCEHVYELVYSSQRTLAQAAGEFLNEKLFVSDDMVAQVVKTKRGKKRLPNTPIIRDLIVFFIESELHEHGPYLVDALLDSNVMIKDWECMTDLLLEDPGPKEEPLDDRQETSLIEIMTCAVRQASTGEPPVSRGPNRKTSLKDAKQVQEDKQKLTEHFMRTLPLLLEKFRMDSDKLVNLLLLPQYFDLEMYIKSRQEGNLDLLLKLMQVIADKHHHLEVLTTCAKTLEVMCLDGNAIATKSKSQRNALVDAVVNKYKEAVDEWNSLLEGEETPDEDETFNIITGLKKVAVFYGCVNMGPWAVWLPIFGHARDAVRGIKPLPVEAIKYSLKACHYGVMWDLKHLEEMKDCGDLNTLVFEVKNRLKQLFDLLKETIHHSNRSLQEHAYLSIVDLLVVFSDHLTRGESSALSELTYVADKELQDSLTNFVLNSIFVSEEQEDHTDPISIEELHKRRNFLAAYCKLIVYGMVPCKCAANIFTYYIKAYHEYGDIIKHTCGKLREADKLACANVITHTLTSLFQEMTKKQQDYRKYRRSAEFAGIKELAKRFALSFGLDSIKNREAVATIHRKGIKFANSEAALDPLSPPPNISYLEIVTEFTCKLLKQDKKLFLTYLDRKIPCGMPSSRSEDWQPFYVYRNSLVHGETDQPLQPSKRAYTRKKKVDEEAVEEDDPSGSESGTGISGEQVVPVNEATKFQKLTKVTRRKFSRGTDGQTSTASNGVLVQDSIACNRPQRQCAIRSLAYKFVDQNSDEDDF